MVYRAALFIQQSPPAITSHDPFFFAVLAGLALALGHAGHRFAQPAPAEPGIARVLGLTFAYFTLAGLALYFSAEFGLPALADFYRRRYD